MTITKMVLLKRAQQNGARTNRLTVPPNTPAESNYEVNVLSLEDSTEKAHYSALQRTRLPRLDREQEDVSDSLYFLPVGCPEEKSELNICRAHFQSPRKKAHVKDLSKESVDSEDLFKKVYLPPLNVGQLHEEQRTNVVLGTSFTMVKSAPLQSNLFSRRYENPYTRPLPNERENQRTISSACSLVRTLEKDVLEDNCLSGNDDKEEL